MELGEIFVCNITLPLPETNIFAPENGWLEDEAVSFWGVKRPIFRCDLMLGLGSVWMMK